MHAFAKLTLLTLPIVLVTACSHEQAYSNKAAVAGALFGTNEQSTPVSNPYQLNYYKDETREFLERIQKAHKPEELQGWAAQVLNKHADAKTPFRLERKELLEWILKLDPPLEPHFVVVYPGSYVTLAWGGGFGVWGSSLLNMSFLPRIILPNIRFHGHRG